MVFTGCPSHANLRRGIRAFQMAISLNQATYNHDQFLAKNFPHISRVGPYSKNLTAHHCAKCGTIWNVVSGALRFHLKNGKHVCPGCARQNNQIHRRLTPEQYVVRLAEISTLVPVETYVNMRTPILHRCVVCTAESRKSPETVLWSKGGASCVGCSYQTRQQRFVRKTATIGGVEFDVQGFELLAIQHLVTSGTPATSIQKTGIPTFRYDFEGRSRLYIPDLCVSGRQIVEVKSLFYFLHDPAWFAQLRAKRQAVVTARFPFRLILFSNRKEFVPTPRGWQNASRESLIAKFGGY